MLAPADARKPAKGMLGRCCRALALQQLLLLVLLVSKQQGGLALHKGVRGLQGSCWWLGPAQQQLSQPPTRRRRTPL